LEYLTFNKFISPDILIIIYYISVAAITLMLFIYNKYFLNKFIHQFKIKSRVLIWLLLILIFLCMQLCLRVFFEIVIGYFDMHNMLYKLTLTNSTLK